MGEIAESMLSGELCEGCGVPNEGEAQGIAWRCPPCDKGDQVDPRPGTVIKRPGRAERARAKAARGDPLPKWQLESPDPVVIRYHCKFCQRHFGLEAAVWDHLRDVHGVSLP